MVTASIRAKMMFSILVMTAKRRRLKPKPSTLAVNRDPVLELCKEEHVPTGTEQTLKQQFQTPWIPEATLPKAKPQIGPGLLILLFGVIKHQR